MAEKAPSFNDLPFSLEGAPCRKPWTYSLGAQSEWLNQTQDQGAKGGTLIDDLKGLFGGHLGAT